MVIMTIAFPKPTSLAGGGRANLIRVGGLPRGDGGGRGVYEELVMARYRGVRSTMIPFYRMSSSTLVELLSVISPMGLLSLPRSISALGRKAKDAIRLIPLLTLLGLPMRGRLGGLPVHWHPLVGLRVVLPGLDAMGIYHHVWFRQEYEKVARPKKGDVVVDVGAHIGLFALRCLKCFGASLVVAVEPHPLNARLLRMNLALNKLDDRALVVEAALGREEGTARLFIARTSDAHSLIYDRSRHEGGRVVEVAVKTMDGLVEELGLERVDFIKIDVEGAELDVLAGAQRTLSEFRPTLVVETHTGKVPGVLEELVNTLRPHGYRLYPIQFHGGVIYLTAVPEGRF